MTTSEPLISILLPVKNASGFLQECLDSIRGQSYQNWELIAINDHSTDNSLSILQKYSNEDSKITHLTNNDHGIIPALRLAYHHSQGELITRMDADDIMSLDKLSLFQNALKTEQNAVAVGLVKYFRENGIGNGYLQYEKWLNQLTLTASNFDEIYRECTIPSPNWMLHRQDLEAIGAFDSETYPEDYDLAFRMYKHGLRPISVPKITHFWRDHNERSSRNDPNYADNRFLDIKLKYFMRLDLEVNQQIVLWGAGKKGKYIAQYLLSQGLDFEWITDNPKKSNSKIYGVLLKVASTFSWQSYHLSIIAIAQPTAQISIQEKMKTLKKELNLNYFFFC